MTQADLARKVGVSRVAVVQWEGDQSEPTHDHLELVARLAFMVDLATFHAEPEKHRLTHGQH